MIDPNTLPYRPCVGMALFNAQGRVFIGKRIDQTQEAWQMPQGGIDEGEEPFAAALRELREEVGTDKATLLREHPEWLTYDLPPHLVGIVWKGRYRGQRLKWFALRFTGEDKDIDLTRHDPEFSEWKWAALDEVLGLVVPFKRAIYTSMVEAFRDLGTAS